MRFLTLKTTLNQSLTLIVNNNNGFLRPIAQQSFAIRCITTVSIELDICKHNLHHEQSDLFLGGEKTEERIKESRETGKEACG